VIVVNRTDPVVPLSFQRRWKSVADQATVVTYRRDAHVATEKRRTHP